MKSASLYFALAAVLLLSACGTALASDLVIAPGQVVWANSKAFLDGYSHVVIQSSPTLGNGILAISDASIFDTAGYLQSKISSDSSGEIGFNGPGDSGTYGWFGYFTGATLNMPALGNGKMWIGTPAYSSPQSTSIYGFSYSGILQPGSDNVYRIQAASQFITWGTTTGNWMDATGTAGAIFRGKNTPLDLKGGQAEVREKIGEIALTGGVTMDHVVFSNTNEGSQYGTIGYAGDPNLGIVKTGVVHPFGNGNLNLINSVANWYPSMDGNVHRFDAQVGNTTFSSVNQIVTDMHNVALGSSNAITIAGLTRKDRGILSFSTGPGSIIKVAGGVPNTNGMAPPYYLYAQEDFADYDPNFGFVPVTYDGDSLVGATAAQKIYTYGDDLSADTTVYAVNTSGDINLGTSNLTINSGGLILAANVNINGAGQLRFNNQEAIITMVYSTVNSISAPIAQAAGLTVSAPSMSNGVSINLTLSAANSITGPVTINGGKLTLAAAGALGTGNDVLLNGGQMIVGANAVVGKLSANNKVTLAGGNLTCNGGLFINPAAADGLLVSGGVDVGTNTLTIHSTAGSDVAAVANMVKTGLIGGIGTSATLVGNQAVGYARWGGDITVKVAVKGDANLNGRVDNNDLGVMLANWGTGTYWDQGEFTGIHVVDNNDLGFLLAGWSSSGSAVPEPATLTLLGAAGLALMRRRNG